MDQEFHTCRTRYLLKSYIETIKKDTLQNYSTNQSINLVDDSDILSSDGKRAQLVEQTISRAIIHFTACILDEKDQTIAGDILSYLSGTNGRRAVYGTHTEDSRG